MIALLEQQWPWQLRTAANQTSQRMVVVEQVVFKQQFNTPIMGKPLRHVHNNSHKDEPT
jgi:hypothetical protein